MGDELVNEWDIAAAAATAHLSSKSDSNLNVDKMSVDNNVDHKKGGHEIEGGGNDDNDKLEDNYNVDDVYDNDSVSSSDSDTSEDLNFAKEVAALEAMEGDGDVDDDAGGGGGGWKR